MKRLFWYLWCLIFWTILWGSIYNCIYLLSDEVKRSETIASIFLVMMLGSLCFGMSLFPQPSTIRREKFLIQSVFFWILYTHVAFPIFWGYSWWITGESCSCDGSFLCFCPPDSLIKAIVLMYSIIWGFAPMIGIVFSVSTLISAIVGSLLFRTLTLRYFVP